jgi:hypothetical protein
MKEVAIRKGQVWEDNRTGRRGVIAGKKGGGGWTIVWGRGGPTASRHLSEQVLWKLHHLVEN